MPGVRTLVHAALTERIERQGAPTAHLPLGRMADALGLTEVQALREVAEAVAAGELRVSELEVVPLERPDPRDPATWTLTREAS